MEAKPRPLLGALLGVLLGIVVVALLWQLGIVPPDRLVLFGILAITTALATIILTQQVVLVRKRFIVVMVFCGLMGGAALTGIPEAIGGGSITGGCSAEGTSSLDSKTPQATSMADPFDVTRKDTVAWKGQSDAVLTNWTSALGMSVGGFRVTIWSDSDENADKEQMNSGNADVASYLADIEGSTGITLAGTYHVFGYIDADGGSSCEMTAYVRVQGDGAFTGTINLALWILLAVLIVIILILALVVRRSITRAALGAASASATVGTGGAAAVGGAAFTSANDAGVAAPPERTSTTTRAFEPDADQPVSPYAVPGAVAEPSLTEKLAEDEAARIERERVESAERERIEPAKADDDAPPGDETDGGDTSKE